MPGPGEWSAKSRPKETPIIEIIEARKNEYEQLLEQPEKETISKKLEQKKENE